MRKKRLNFERHFKSILILILIIFIIIIFTIVYSQIARPMIHASIVDSYNQGANDILDTIVIQVEQRGFTKIFSENKTVTLVPYNK